MLRHAAVPRQGRAARQAAVYKNSKTKLDPLRVRLRSRLNTSLCNFIKYFFFAEYVNLAAVTKKTDWSISNSCVRNPGQ